MSTHKVSFQGKLTETIFQLQYHYVLNLLNAPTVQTHFADSQNSSFSYRIGGKQKCSIEEHRSKSLKTEILNVNCLRLATFLGPCFDPPLPSSFMFSFAAYSTALMVTMVIQLCHTTS